MGFFSKTRKVSGWKAFSLRKEGICIVHATRPASGQPVVELATLQPLAGTAAGEGLARVAKEQSAARFHCSLVLSAGEYHLLSVEAPNVPPDELKTAIRWRLKDMLDFHVDDATIDVLDIPADTAAQGRSRSMYAVAAKNQLIQQRQAAFADARIPLSVIDIPEMAQRNISALLETEGRGVAFLSFDAEGGLLTVTFKGELYLSRRIDVPLSQLQQGSIEDRNACYDRVTLELQRSLDHFDRQYHFITVAKLYILPLGQEAAGLQQYLGSNLYVPVEQFDCGSVLDISRVRAVLTDENMPVYFMALGAALRHEETAL